jgi:hypothetical protein
MYYCFLHGINLMLALSNRSILRVRIYSIYLQTEGNYGKSNRAHNALTLWALFALKVSRKLL